MHRAIFMDRDGTLNRDPGYIGRPEEMVLLPGVPEAVRLIHASGWLAVVVTNQAGIARGHFTEEDLRAVHRRLAEEITSAGGRLDGIYHCPHHPEAGEGPYTRPCSCRKPEPGLLLRAGRELGIDLARSWMVGDRAGDIEAGSRAGCRTILVLTGEGSETLREISAGAKARPDHVFGSLLEAVRFVISPDSRGRAG